MKHRKNSVSNIVVDKGDVTNPRTDKLDIAKCASLVDGQFKLVLISARRAREIKRQNLRSQKFEHNHPGVTALLEIQEGKVGQEYLYKKI